MAGIVAIAIPMAGTAAILDSKEKVDAEDLEGALEEAEKAVDIQPYSATANLQEALVLELLGDLEGAEAAAITATENEPTNWRTWLVLSRLQHKLGDAEGSIGVLSPREVPQPTLRPVPVARRHAAAVSSESSMPAVSFRPSAGRPARRASHPSGSRGPASSPTRRIVRSFSGVARSAVAHLEHLRLQREPHGVRHVRAPPVFGHPLDRLPGLGEPDDAPTAGSPASRCAWPSAALPCWT